MLKNMLKNMLQIVMLWCSLVAAVQACDTQELFELVAQRLSYMPAVAQAKIALAYPVEDLEREAVIVQQSRAQAVKVGLPEQAVTRLMVAQMTVAKALQWREPEPVAGTVDGNALFAEIRPVLSALGRAQLETLGCLRQADVLLVETDYEAFSVSQRNNQLLPNETRSLFLRLQEVLAAP